MAKPPPPPETPLPPNFFEQAAFERPFNTPPLPPRRRRSVPIFTPKVVIWTMLGALSAGYMAIAFTSPDWLSDLAATPRVVEADANPLANDAGDLAAEFGALRETVAHLQAEVTTIRTEVDSAHARQTSMATELGTLNNRLASPTPTSPLDTQAPAAAPKIPKLINADGAAPSLETGSVATPANAIAFGPAIVKAFPKPMGIQISSGPTIESLRVSWSLLSDNYGAELKNLQPRYATKGDAVNPNYDLVAGPMKSKADAIKVCKALVDKSVPCTVTEYVGNAL